MWRECFVRAVRTLCLEDPYDLKVREEKTGQKCSSNIVAHCFVVCHSV